MVTLQLPAPVSQGAVTYFPDPTSFAVREIVPAEPSKPRLLDRVREAVRARHGSRRTEEIYVAWIRRYILFHGKRHPVEMGAAEITQFLTSLAVEGKVAAATQNQALSALLFLYREVLALEIPWLDGLVRAKRPERLPVVLSRDEVRAVLQRLEGSPRLMAYLLYGAGLRLLECCRLRVQDVDFGANQVTVRGGKGDKDRVTMLPAAVKADLARHLEVVRRQQQLDLQRGAGWVELPDALARKYPNAGREWAWQWVFPVTRMYVGPGHGPAAPPPPARVRPATCCQGRGPARRPREARQPPYSAPLVRYAPTRGRARHPNGAGTARAPGCRHNDDLHPRPEPRAGGGAEPSGPDVQPVRSHAPRRRDRPTGRTRRYRVTPRAATSREFNEGGNGQPQRGVSATLRRPQGLPC